MKDLIHSVIEAFFLGQAPYVEMRKGSNPALRGLGIVVLVAVVVALVGLVGTALEWATMPNMSDVQTAVLKGIQQMPWYQKLPGNAEFREQFQQWYDMGWQVFPQLFGAPSIPIAASRIILLPLGLTFVWFLYGLAAHLCARLLGGQGGLGQTLGCTALAIAPQLLNIATIFPYLVVGGVVGTWTLLCRYVALKTCHRLTWSRALAATLLPYVAYIAVISLFACLGSMLFGYLISEGGLQ